MLDSLGNPTLHIIAQIFYKENKIKVSDTLLLKKIVIESALSFLTKKTPSSYNGIMATKWGILVFECNSALLVALCIWDNADRADTTQSHRSCNSFWTVDKNFVFPDLQKALIPRNPRFTWSAESRWKAFITALSAFTEVQFAFCQCKQFVSRMNGASVVLDQSRNMENNSYE